MVISESKALIDKALSRSNLNRTEQRRIGLMLKDALSLCEFQSNRIKALTLDKSSVVGIR